MSELENFAREASQIETEIARCFVALDVDPENAAQMRELAREALHHSAHGIERELSDPQESARLHLFGLAQLMLTVMRESAQERHLETHGGPNWKAFARALWAEHRVDLPLAPEASGS